MPLIECVPNISEGQDAAVIAALAATLDGVRHLDTHTDPDHNRTVFTFAGEVDTVKNAAMRLAAEAAALIDLRRHTGEHPRIGALDVLPLVPLRGISLAETGEIARGLAARISAEVGLPTYLYDAAHPDERSLPHTRRTGYEWLREAITTEHPPDFGPRSLGPAGAVCVGARGLLVAFNVYLQTDDVSIAQSIARAVRESSGGMAGVRALGMLVGGRAQVSMNLITPREVGPTPVVARIRSLAAAHGTAVSHSELVGMLPRAAAEGSETWALRPPLGDRVLEDALNIAPL